MLLALALPARATVLVPADLGELSRDARAIVRGRVAAVDAQWTEDRGTIETIVTLEVESYLKGSLGSDAAVSACPAASSDGSAASSSARRSSRVDERVVVFLGARGPSVPYVLGLNQGVFRVVRARPTMPGGS